MSKETLILTKNKEVTTGSCLPLMSDGSRASTASGESTEKDLGMATCRVCHCAESDKQGDAVLHFLGISPLLQQSHRDENGSMPNSKKALKDVKGDLTLDRDGKLGSDFVDFISPEGEIFVCNTDIEMGPCHHQDTLIELGCSCKSDLALVHYACALKWFINHGSTVCEICGCVATNIRSADFRRVLASLKEYEELRERTASGTPNPAQLHYDSGIDPDAVAAIRRRRLSDISLWFNPHNNDLRNNNNNSAPTISLVVGEQRQMLPMKAPPLLKILLPNGLRRVLGFCWLLAYLPLHLHGLLLLVLERKLRKMVFTFSLEVFVL
ncbi:hypothetical protein Nepgr_001679 [Nepenthes gracilis]|uniref:RING-CH-type domain-containing protein n=1 Tax=Nepenthes gracilis TaxID=150966 RepID=A0AAD3RXX3_NEPGR|nr:hypothetical protein Nepgr_001679 [Nepenthes gracilis]